MAAPSPVTALQNLYHCEHKISVQTECSDVLHYRERIVCILEKGINNAWVVNSEDKLVGDIVNQVLDGLIIVFNVTVVLDSKQQYINTNISAQIKL